MQNAPTFRISREKKEKGWNMSLSRR